MNTTTTARRYVIDLGQVDAGACVPGNTNALVPVELRNDRGEVVLALGNRHVTLSFGGSRWAADGRLGRVGTSDAPMARSIGVCVAWKSEPGARRAAARWLVSACVE